MEHGLKVDVYQELQISHYPFVFECKKVVVYQELQISGPHAKADFWCTRLMGTMFCWMLKNPSTQTVAAAAIMKPHALRGLANLDT